MRRGKGSREVGKEGGRRELSKKGKKRQVVWRKVCRRVDMEEKGCGIQEGEDTGMGEEG